MDETCLTAILSIITPINPGLGMKLHGMYKFLHSHCRENLKSYIALTGRAL
jgi:hypothetical protein